MPRKTPNIFTPFSSSLSQQEQRVWVQKFDEEMIGFGRFKVAKKKFLNVGIVVVAFASIGALVFFKPTSTSTSPSSVGGSAGTRGESYPFLVAVLHGSVRITSVGAFR